MIKSVDLIILSIVIYIVVMCIKYLISSKSSCSGCAGGNCASCRAAITARKVAQRASE